MYRDSSNILHISREEEFILTDCGFVNISSDLWADNPRDYCDNLFTILSFDRNYQFDYNEFYDFDDFLFQTKKDYLRFSLSLRGDELIIDDSWNEDSCFFAYVNRETILKEYNVKKISKNILSKVKDVLKSELFVLSSFLKGDIFYIYFNNEELQDENFGGIIGESFEDNGLEYYLGNIYISFNEKNIPNDNYFEELKQFDFYSKFLEDMFEVKDLGPCVSISKDFMEEIFSKDNFLNEIFDEKDCPKLKKDLRIAMANCMKEMYTSEI